MITKEEIEVLKNPESPERRLLQRFIAGFGPESEICFVDIDSTGFYIEHFNQKFFIDFMTYGFKQLHSPKMWELSIRFFEGKNTLYINLNRSRTGERREMY